MSKVVHVEYRCHGCPDAWASVPVPERAEHEDVCAWVEMVRHLVHHHHTVMQPKCPSKVVDLKIPLPPDEPGAWIGKAPSVQ